MLNIFDLLFYYITYSFLGWCIEVLYAYKNQHRFVNRGFLHGPLCPIYGTCTLIILLLLHNFNCNIIKLLIFATILTSFIEYVTGFILEKLFNKKYWDYSDDPFNFHGRICLGFSFMWGFLCVFIIKVFQPFLCTLINFIPVYVRMTLVSSLTFFVIFDLYITLNSLIDIKSLPYTLQSSCIILINKFDLKSNSANVRNKISKILNKKLS